MVQWRLVQPEGLYGYGKGVFYGLGVEGVRVLGDYGFTH